MNPGSNHREDRVRPRKKAGHYLGKYGGPHIGLHDTGAFILSEGTLNLGR